MSDPAGSRPVLIGLTGPIGCGKSTVAAMLGEIGGMVVDADALARQATAPGTPALDAIRARFGETVFAADASLDRSALAAIVFADPTALADLEQLIHPQVRALVERELVRAAEQHVPFVSVEAIKLVEGGLAERCDEVWLVECGAETQRERLLRRGMTADDIGRRIATQGDGLAERLAELLRTSAPSGGPAVRRISTDGPLEETRETVEQALADALEPYLISGS